MKELFLYYDCGCVIKVQKQSQNLEFCFFHGKGVVTAEWKNRAARHDRNARISNAKAPRIDDLQRGGGTVGEGD